MARLVSHLGALPGLAHSSLYHARERRRARKNFSEFSADIASPFDLGTVAAASPLPNPYVMPAGSRLAVSFSAGLTAGQLTIATQGRTLGTPDLAADEIRRLDLFQQSRTVTPTSAVAGTLTLYVLDEWSRPFAVATGTFS